MSRRALLVAAGAALLALALILGFRAWHRGEEPAARSGSRQPKAGAAPSGRSPRTRVDAIAYGTVTVHPKFDSFAPPGGTLEIRMMDLERHRPALTRTFQAVRFPLSYELLRSDAVTPDALDAVRRNDFYLDVTYVPPSLDGAPVRQLVGEAWGTAGKPVAMRAGAEADLTLAAFRRPEIHDGPPGEPSKAPAAEGRAGAAPEGALLLHGTITVDPDLAKYAPAGGSLHVRIVCLDLRRPCMFDRVTDVDFPLDYAFHEVDAVSEIGLHAIRDGQFFVEAFYSPPGENLYIGRGDQLGGEAWGAAGKPQPLHAGARADIVLGSFWTPRVLNGALTHRPHALFEGWIYPRPALEGKLGAHNRLTFLMFEAPRVPGQRDPHPTVLAAKVFEDIDPTRPLACHVGEEDFLVHPIDEDWKAYYEIRLENLSPDGKPVTYLWGGRASAKVSIGVRVKGLKLVFVEERQNDPFANVGLDLHGIHPSPPTYE